VAAISNLFIDQGTDYSSVVTVVAANGAPLNLSGYTVKSQMRKSYSSSQVYNFNASVLDAATGRIRLSLTAAGSEVIPAGRWLYDVEITSDAGIKRRVVEGIITVTPQITQT
jgi:hypothetical protein